MHIYVHIPFCARKCPYCGFCSVAGEKDFTSYFDALNREIDAQGVVPSASYPDEMTTVYFGGGTPSYVGADLICGTFRKITEKYGITDGEFTIEVNPNSFDEAKGRAYREAGFNRISIGVQSLHDDTLKTLGRLHDSAEALRAIRDAKEAGFTNISCDLIIGVPGQKLQDIYDDAGALIDAGAKHISMYSLMIEEGTPFDDLYGEGLDEYVDPELERQMYHGLRSYLKKRGLHPYEISNCAYEGYESRHNLSYWRGCEYYAFGAGAHGYLDSVRFSHGNDVAFYISCPEFVNVEERMTEEDKIREKCMLLLRTSEGISNELASHVRPAVKKHLKTGYLRKTPDGKGYCLSREGLDFANLVFMDVLY